MCNLLFCYASTCSLYVDPLQARPTKCCGRRSGYGITCSFYMYAYHRAYNIYYLDFVIWASTTTTSVYNNNVSWHCAQRTGDLQHFRHYLLNCTPSIILPLLNKHVILWGSSWIKHTLAVRGYVTRTCVWLFGEESACITGRWALGCSETVMLNIWRIVYVEAQTSCWAVGLMPTTTCISKTSPLAKSSVPLFVNVWGGVPLFVIRPFFFVAPPRSPTKRKRTQRGEIIYRLKDELAYRGVLGSVWMKKNPIQLLELD